MSRLHYGSPFDSSFVMSLKSSAVHSQTLSTH